MDRKRQKRREVPVTTKAVAYARVSSKEQDNEGFSIPAQQKLLRNYAASEGLNIVQEFVDVETAKVAGRTNFVAMVRYLKAHPDVRAILVEKTDRLYRNIKDWVTLSELDVDLHFPKEGEVLSRGSSSSAKFMHGIRVLMAKNYIDNLSEEARKGMQEKAEQGIWPSSAPLGYLNVAGPHGKRVIEIDPVLGPIVSQMFGWYAAGDLSLLELADRAKAAGLVNRLSGGPIGRSAIAHILHNPIYMGEFVWTGHVYKGTHQPLVSHELWIRVQEMLESRNERRIRRSKHDFTFSGIIKCGHCGCAMVAELKKGRYVYYHCTGFKGKCNERYVREEVIAEELSLAMGRLRLGDRLLSWLTDALRIVTVDHTKEHAAAVARLQAEYDRIQGRLQAMYVDKLDGRIDAAFFDLTAAKWREEQDDYLREIHFHKTADGSYLEDGISLLRLVNEAASTFKETEQNGKRRLMNFALSNCSWKNGQLTVEFRQPFEMIATIGSAPSPGGGCGGVNSPPHPIWWARQDSNLQPDRYERSALTIELQAPVGGAADGADTPYNAHPVAAIATCD